MATPEAGERVVTATRSINADNALVFELIADPAQHPRWDGNENLSEAQPGQRVRAVGDVFSMTLTRGSVRENHVVEFTEGRRIAWRPAEADGSPVGQLWRWELEPLHDSLTRVTHTYDWRQLKDESRIARAEWTTSDRLAASLARLAALVEHPFLESDEPS